MMYILTVIAGIAVGWAIAETQRRRAERDQVNRDRTNTP